jgi:N-acylneuraminate cytidylyltransferase
MSGRAPALAIVPARAGSQGLPGKNLADLGGRSLLARAVDAATGAGIERVVVSTDGAEIAAAARALGCEVVDRPPELALSTSRTVDALLLALDALAVPDDVPVVLLQPTSPLRTHEDVARTLERHARADVRTALTTTPVEHHPLKSLLLDPDGIAHPIRGWADLESPRQELPAAHRINGAVYVATAGTIRAERRVVVPPLGVVEMPADRSIDIDTRADLEAARALLAAPPG